MSSAPPPSYPPSYQASKRAQRDAYRAQQNAARAQRNYWRALRRPSLTRPIVLISIGVVALLIESGKLPAFVFWSWYTRWWPVLLICVGILLLAEWWFNRDRPYGVRGAGGGLIVLLVLLVFFGFAGHRLHRSGPFNWNFNPDDNSWGMHLFGQEHDEDHQFDQSLPPDSNVRIENPHGDVTVTTSDDGRIHVSAHNTVYASNDRDAAQQLRRLLPRFTVNGRAATLTTTGIDRGSSDLTVQLPPGSTAEIDAAHGDVSVDGLKGTITINSGHGDVKLNEIGNTATAHMSKGDLSAHNLTGALTVDGRLDDATLSGIKGHVTLNGDFFGDVHLSDIAAPVSFHSSRTTFDVERVDGELSLDSGDLRMRQSSAPVNVNTHAKDIELTGITGGPVQVENADGDIALSIAAQPGDIQMHNGNGDIDVTLPENTAYTVNATAPMGDIVSDWTLDGAGVKDEHSFSGRIGTGSRTANLKLVSDHGSIHLKKGSLALLTPPGPPAPPPPPRNARHLKAPEGAPPQPSEQ